MPIPQPKKNEEHDAFISRCHSAIAEEYDDSEQRHAICEQTWRDKDKKKDKMSTPHFLRAGFTGRPAGVDRKVNVLRGFVLAQQGPFKSDGRGEFTADGLREIVRLGNATPKGLKSRLGHPSLSDDGIGKFLGRARDLSLGRATDARTGQTVPAVRGDLHFDRTALEPPPGGGGKALGVYVMDLAESDPDAFSSSLVLDARKFVEGKGGKMVELAEGEEPPRDVTPVWLPKRLHASDIVDTGDAVDGLLSAPELAEALSVGLTPELQRLLRFDRVARLAAQLLDGLFPAAGKAEVDERCRAWLARYLDGRFGTPPPVERPRLAERLGRLAGMAERVKGV